MEPVAKTPALQARQDPRLYQIAVLTLLLLYGLVWLDFAVDSRHIAAILATVLGMQALGTAVWRLPRYDPRSALISGLSLCLLLRTPTVWWAVAAAVIAIGSKFVLRWRGKHLFNPTNLGIVALLLSGQVWVSPGQWGSTAFFAMLIACLGGLVAYRAARSDVALMFATVYILLQGSRAVYLGDPLSIPLHQLQNGAFLLFTFFMISDPKTTPDSRLGRLVFASLVACGAMYVQFRLYRSTGLLWALACSALAVPLLDGLLPGTAYAWPVGQPVMPLFRKGVSYVQTMVWP